ncbi:MAG: FMN-binding negative transcriptional regulator [Rhodospirillales bacterium]
MHPNRAFRQAADDEILAFARARSFGVLAMSGPDGPLASHIPFVIGGDGSALEAHIVRSNPVHAVLRDAGDHGVEAMMIVSGPDGYVSPDWYGIEDQVPTWNYVAVHLWGRLRLTAEDELRPHLERLSAQFESRLQGKTPWRLDKVSEEKYAALARAIAKVEMEITKTAGTWKLSQNKPDEARLGAADGVRGAGVGSETDMLARLMMSA